jgi:hypothetical protein
MRLAGLQVGRLLVHDWSEHADNAVHQLLKKRGERFADRSEPFNRNGARGGNRSQTVCEPFTTGSGSDTNRSRLPELAS